MFDSNVKGVLFTVQKALPLLCDEASIILNASIAASKGLPSGSVYSATKAAVRSFAQTWTTDLKPRRIRVNAVSPSFTETPGFNELLASSPGGHETRKMIAGAAWLGRLAEPDGNGRRSVVAGAGRDGTGRKALSRATRLHRCDFQILSRCR